MLEKSIANSDLERDEAGAALEPPNPQFENWVVFLLDPRRCFREPLSDAADCDWGARPVELVGSARGTAAARDGPGSLGAMQKGHRGE